MEYSWHCLMRDPLRFYALATADFTRCAGVVTTRCGGYSHGPYEGLNLSLASMDNKEHVTRNRAVVLAALGLAETEGAWPEQVHGNSVLEALSPSLAGGADGLMTTRAELWLAILVADCVPVFAFDAELSCVGIAHAGRGGTKGGITKALIKRIISSSHLTAKQIVIALGPSIGPCCYELNHAIASQFPGAFVEKREGRFFVDLWRLNRWHALTEGIPEENIVPAPGCTSCRRAEFFSHRRDAGRTGRQMAVTRVGGLATLTRV